MKRPPLESPLPASAPVTCIQARHPLCCSDDSSSEAIIAAFEADAVFSAFARKETDDTLARDAEDGKKLAAGIAMAVAKVCGS